MSNKNTSTATPPNMSGTAGPGSRFLQGKEKPQNAKETLKRLWNYFKGEKKQLFSILGVVIVDSAIVLTVPFLIGRAIDAMSISQGDVDFQLLKNIIIVLLTAYVLDTILTFSQEWMIAGSSQRIVQRMRESLFAKLQKLPIAFFDSRPHGEIMSRLTNDIDNVSTTISQSTAQLISGFFTVLGSLVMMFILSPILTLAAMIMIPMVFFLTKTIAKKTSLLFKEQQATLGSLNGKIEETISGIEIVKAFNHEEKAIIDFEEANVSLRKVGLKAQIYSGFLMPLMNVINNFGFTIIASLGGLLATQEMITVGVIASFLTYSRQFSRPLIDMANIFNTLQSAIAGAERVFHVLDEPEETVDEEHAKEACRFHGDVVFEHVQFGYHPGQPIVKNMNFTVSAGSMVALVGPTGAGKTTVVNLLTRFYDVTDGKILIDDVDIRNYTRESLRKNFGIVLQDTYLFAGTIKENILYGRLDASDEEIVQAAKMANVHSFIDHLPFGYDTVLIEGGGNISQGQRQLLAIARAILADPSILILDEATSNIDTRTELRIQEALLHMMQGRTSFVIAHRLSTIREADMIMVIDDGEIVEMGNHDELLEKKGTYFEMYEKQMKNQVV